MLKKIFDRSSAFLLLVFLTPLFLVVVVLVRWFHGAPVFFCQQRPGLHGKPFIMYKFRTMKNTVDEQGILLSDEDRLTSFGYFLRATSLDELPELWNVLRGEMSLVGPRPLLMEYLDKYTPEQARRHEVKPGITGWAQVNGRNSIDWNKRLALDVWYVDNRTFFLDLDILSKTIIKVFKREDIQQEGQATMSKFKGSEE